MNAKEREWLSQGLDFLQFADVEDLNKELEES